jgi:glycosyltransferase involved in cell wall biosynthesis
MLKYSAVITSFNSENTIEKALASILNQEIPPVEILLIDDNSQDSTVTLARNFQLKSENLQIIINEKNKGQAFNRNLAAKLSNSEYLIFFDDDDFSLSTRSTLHANHFKSGSEISFVSSLKKYPKGFEAKFINSNITTNPSVNELIKLLILGHKLDSLTEVYIPSSTCAVSKAALMSVNGFDESLRRLEDIDLAVRFGIKHYKFSWSSEVGVIRTHTENSFKGKGIDSSFEEVLIHKYKYLMNDKDFDTAMIHMQTRKLYFSQNYRAFLFHILKNPRYSSSSILRGRRFIKRLYHDFRKST